jgi:hypothetical protein
LAENPPKGIGAELEHGEFIIREKVDRQDYYQINGNKTLCLPIREHRLIQELLGLIDQRKAFYS